MAQRTRAGGMGNGTLVSLHGDHLGSVSIVTGDGGAKVSRQEYIAWGQVRDGDNSATTPLDYTGQHRDGTGLLYYGARYYDPALGRFLSPDTLGETKGNPQSWNPYSYARNNPVNKTDPTGHDPTSGGNPNDPSAYQGPYPYPYPYPYATPGARPYSPYIPVGTPYMPPMGNACQLRNVNCTTATPTTMPYSTPTAGAYCATPAADASCASATATMTPPTATATPQTIYTAMGTGTPFATATPSMV